MPHGHGVAADRGQHVVFVNQTVAHEITDAIVVTAHAMYRAFAALASTKPTKVLPSRAREKMQQVELIVLKIGTLPDLEQVRGDGEVALARRLAQLQDDDDRARDERESGNYRRDSRRKLPIYDRHSVPTLATASRRINSAPEHVKTQCLASLAPDAIDAAGCNFRNGDGAVPKPGRIQRSSAEPVTPLALTRDRKRASIVRRRGGTQHILLLRLKTKPGSGRAPIPIIDIS